MILLGSTLFHVYLLLYFTPFFSFFFLRRFEDKRSSEGTADSGFEVLRRGFFVV